MKSVVTALSADNLCDHTCFAVLRTLNHNSTYLWHEWNLTSYDKIYFLLDLHPALKFAVLRYFVKLHLLPS